MYRSPSNSQADDEQLISYLQAFISKINPKNDKLVLVGDFNLPNINWEYETRNNDPSHVNNKFLNLMHEHYLTQFINDPTHCRANQNPTLIDLLLSNDSDFVYNINQVTPLGLSHHNVITFVLNINQPNVSLPPKTVYLINKGDYPAMKNYFNEIEWDTILQDSTDVDILWESIEQEISNAKEKFVPKRVIKKQSRNYRPKFPVPNSLLELFHHKRAAFKQWRRYPTDFNKEVYITYRNKVNTEVKKSKREKEVQIANEAKSNPKALYNYISSQSKPKESVSNLIKEDGQLTEDDLEKANVLNNFFSSVFVTEGDTPSPPFESNYTSTLSTINVSVLDMENQLKSLKINKSPGPDGIHPKLLYECAKVLAYPLKLLFDATMKTGKIPSKWKIAEVKPLFKKGSKSIAGNYRPVSLTSIVCKVFESFVRDAVNSHLISNNLLAPQQFGFCKGRSCVTNLLNTLQDWFQFIDQNIPVDAIYLDFRKAFDSVPHKRLIEKLTGYGIQDSMLSWIKDFLTNRTQYVTVNNSRSHSVPVSSGVPQGSVLGPSLFIYFINDLPSMCEAFVTVFADDTKTYKEIKSTEDCCILQRTINALDEWSDRWLIGFNADKCNVLHLGRNNIRHDYYMKKGNEYITLKKSDCEKDLGVYVDSQLNFNTHISTQIKKARSAAGVINRHIINKTPNIMVPLFKAMVRPILEYANCVWAPYLKKDVNALESIQRHFTKKIVGLNGLSYKERLTILKLPSLSYRRLRGDLIETYKIVNSIYDPVTTQSLLTRVPDKSITRKTNSFNLTKIRANKNPFKYFFTNRINNVWNSLPNQIVDARNLNIFKNRLDSHFRGIKYTILGN